MAGSLNEILYDPLSYLHSQRLKLNFSLISTPLCRSIVNDMIFDIFHLTVPNIQVNTQSRFWIHHWYNIPQIAYLIGCHASREELMWRGRILNIPLWAKDYLKIASSYAPKFSSPPGEPFTHSLILNAGYSGLISYIEGLPEPLRQRIPLLFPDCIDGVNSQFTVNPFILRVISHYVEKNKVTLSCEVC
ncbi:type III secretion apparatus protein OrgA/MxiK [Yersinia enterocolitica]|nr:type III secretion apparatus protein OrgA/MxiK [Yersinia enterocolitica]